MTSTPSWYGGSSSGSGSGASANDQFGYQQSTPSSPTATPDAGEADLLGLHDGPPTAAAAGQASFEDQQGPPTPAESFQSAAAAAAEISHSAAAPSTGTGYGGADGYGGSPFRSDSEGVAEEYGEVGSHPGLQSSRPSGKQLGGAAVAGGIAGAVVAGPLVGLAAAAGAAYAATTRSTAGDVARGTGSAISSVGDRTKQFSDEHGVTERTWTATKSAVEGVQQMNERHDILENTKRTTDNVWKSARNFNEEHGVVENTTRTMGNVWQSARNFDNEHQVSRNVGKGFVAAGSLIGSMITGTRNGQSGASTGRSPSDDSGMY